MTDAHEIAIRRLQDQLRSFEAELVNARNESERRYAQDRVNEIVRDIQHRRSGAFKVGS